ncbi:acyl carrier protein [Fibrivirga algicola]|jgi:acyl carrier protein|uniref:Acyl carrier protein n=1 Tax=Fibrivirga algicola TaxID=2950420 RepID=A0ABX0QMB9_9BACT|nr:hypothetical protein [Fibrivirga algicola]NID13614.1 hypothetical protein [Fibrivirga algicola]
MQTIEAQICHYVTKRYTVLPLTIQPDHRFQQDLGLSEWEFLDVLVHIEHLFGVSLPDELLIAPLTINGLSRLIDRYALI